MANTTSDPLARMERIPIWPYGKLLLVVIGFGYFFSYFDIVNMGFTIPSISQHLNVPIPKVVEAINWNLYGYIVGALVISFLSDAFGRKVSIISALFILTIGSLITAFTSSMQWINIGRFIVGMGDGAMIAQVTTYLSELSPAKMRGKITAIATACAFGSSAVVPFVALGLVPNFSWGWRGLLLIGAFSGIVALFGIKYLIESPRWLVSKGRLSDAEKFVSAAEAIARRKYGDELPPVVALPKESKVEGFPLKHVLHPRYIGYLILLLVIWFWVYIGTYGVLGLSTTLLVERGFSLASSIGFQTVTSLGYVAGFIIALTVADRFERKYLAIVTGLAYGLFTLLIGFAPSGNFIMIYGFLQTVSIPVFLTAAYILSAEHFPTNSRSTAVATTDGIGHLGGAVAAPLVMAANAYAGFTGSFVFMGATIILGSLLFVFSKKTTGKSLNVVTAGSDVAAR